MLKGMRTGDELLEAVRAAQEELGAGDPAVALAAVEPLLEQTAEELRSLDYLRRTPQDRARVIEAFCYARVTAVLALESSGATEAMPRIRRLAAEARDAAAGGNPCWKVLCAAAEMLARGGDADGAARELEAAVEIAPDDEPYPRELRASIRSMFPEAFARRDAP